MKEIKITDYFLMIEQDRRDPASDLLAVRREGGRMFEGEKPADALAGSRWYGVKYTCVDRIARSGNSSGKVVMTTRYLGWLKLTHKEIRGNALAQWLEPYPAPANLAAM
jgi:hypothetical protein